MPKVEVHPLTKNGQSRGRSAWILCPGCKYVHAFTLDVKQDNGSVWTWNGDVEKPTFSPSMLVNETDASRRCHSFVTNGNIQFLNDCFHKLAGQTVPLPDVDEQL